MADGIVGRFGGRVVVGALLMGSLLACGEAVRPAGPPDTASESTTGSGGSSVEPSSGGTAADTTSGLGGADSTAPGSGGAGTAGSVGGQPEPFPLPEQCTPGSETTTDGACELAISCDERTRVASCHPSTGRCRCEGEGPRDYWFQGLAPEMRCAATASACLEPPAFSDWQCAVPNGESSPGAYCTALAECSRTATLGDATLTQRQVHSVGCNARGAESWECNCVLPDGSDTRFIVDQDRSCATVFDWCVFDRFERQGTPSCAPVDSAETETDCHAQWACTQQASVGGDDITLQEILLTYCNLQEDGSWACTCPAGRGSFSVQTDDAQQACQRAESLCLTAEQRGE